MIRSTTPNDTIALIAIAEASGLFQPNQLDEIGEMLTDYFGSNSSNSDYFWITDDDEDDGPVGVAYCAPEPMTDGTWNLQLGVDLARLSLGARSAESIASNRL